MLRLFKGIFAAAFFLLFLAIVFDSKTNNRLPSSSTDVSVEHVNFKQIPVQIKRGNDERKFNFKTQRGHSYSNR